MVYDSSLLEDVGEVAHKEGFKKILDSAVEPVLEMCQRMADMSKDNSAWERAIFLINCYVYLQVRISSEYR